MTHKIISIFKSEHAVSALYLALLSGAIANLIPDPTDALNFYLDRKYRIKLEKGEITPSQYWKRKIGLYYGMDSIWWILVLLIAITIGGDIRRKAWVVGSIIGVGALIGVVFQNIRKDKEFFDKYKLIEK